MEIKIMTFKNRVDRHGSNHDHLPSKEGEQMAITREQVVICGHLYIYIIINNLYRQMTKAVVIYGVFVFFRKITDDQGLIKDDHLLM